MIEANNDEFGLEELMSADDTSYDTVKAYGKTVVIGSLCSADMIEWIEGNENADTKKFAGLNILVKSVVEVTRDGTGKVIKEKRIPEEKRAEAIELFKHKDARNNGRVIAAILKLNGLNVARVKQIDTIKNDSSEAITDASPSVSQGTSIA